MIEAVGQMRTKEFKMSITTNTVDFIALLTYRTMEEGGRKTQVFKTGYRPQIKFEFSEMQSSGQQKFLDKEIVYPGDKVEVEIQLLTPDFFENKLTEGMNFEFREGSKIIGTGEIKLIINERLMKASH